MSGLTASRCLFCDGLRLVSQPALIAPFLRERAGLQQRTTSLDTCADCGGRQFRDRLEESEVARLYDGYRSREYLEQRRRFEPWYTEGLNAGLASDVALRRAAIEAALKDAGLEPRGPALDFGGDTGELFPRAVPLNQCSVLDPSGTSLAGGLRRTRSLSEFPDASLGFVMACQVFEHVSSPFDVLVGLVKKMRPGGSFYCEVPDEADFRDYSFSASSQARWLRWVAPRLRLVQAADFVSLACRRGLGVIPPLGFVKMHEHLSFFTLKSLEALFARSGLEVQLLRRTRTTAPILQLCARLPED